MHEGGIIRHKIVIHTEKCTGCRACEIACSFHHTRCFSRKATSIEVLRNEEEGKMEIILHKSEEDSYRSCDECCGEETALCAKYCATGAIELVNYSGED